MKMLPGHKVEQRKERSSIVFRSLKVDMEKESQKVKVDQTFSEFHVYI